MWPSATGRASPVMTVDTQWTMKAVITANDAKEIFAASAQHIAVHVMRAYVLLVSASVKSVRSRSAGIA